MNQKPDLHGYVLGELSGAERKEIEQLLSTDAQLALEVERLRLTHNALRRLPDEEPPRRIAFVSDKVFEPKWWQVWWNSGARLAFAGASMLAVAIVAHGMMTKATPPPNVEAIVQARLRQEVAQEVARRLEPAIAQAVARTEARQQVRTQEMLTVTLRDYEHKSAKERSVILTAVDEEFVQMRKQMGRLLKNTASATDMGGIR